MRSCQEFLEYVYFSFMRHVCKRDNDYYTRFGKEYEVFM